jgi:hypothetical protein
LLSAKGPEFDPRWVYSINKEGRVGIGLNLFFLRVGGKGAPLDGNGGRTGWGSFLFEGEMRALENRSFFRLGGRTKLGKLEFLKVGLGGDAEQV